MILAKLPSGCQCDKGIEYSVLVALSLFPYFFLSLATVDTPRKKKESNQLKKTETSRLAARQR